jgi:hypothetical protein
MGGWPESFSHCARPTRGVRDRALREHRRPIRPPHRLSGISSQLPFPLSPHQSHYLLLSNSLLLLIAKSFHSSFSSPTRSLLISPYINGGVPLHPLDRRQPGRVRTVSPGAGSLFSVRGPSNSLYISLGEWPRLPSTARIGRAQLHRARSASKEGTWPLPPHPS